jgi:hypothetical protein
MLRWRRHQGERAPSTMAGAIGLGSGAGWTNTGPPVPRYWGSGAPFQIFNAPVDI